MKNDSVLAQNEDAGQMPHNVALYWGHVEGRRLGGRCKKEGKNQELIQKHHT